MSDSGQQALATSVANERQSLLAPAREWLRLTLHLARKMVPTRHLVFIAAVRLTIGLSVIRLSQVLPWETARYWGEFGGRIFVVLAVMNLLAHPEGIFMDAVCRNFERLTGIKLRG